MKIKHSAGLVSILLSLLLVFSLLPTGVIAADDDVTLTIIHVNDRHGRMSADPYISQLAKDTKGNVLILDAGDALHGQITANLSKGAAMIELMNEVGYSAMVLGNHEFTYGIERIAELSELADFPMLAANVKDSDGENLFQSCVVFEMDGITVGVFGLATPETIASSDPRLLAGIAFDDPATTAKTEVAELQAKGCDIIIALTHMGVDNLSEAKDRSDNLATVPGIDVIIDGHSHTELPNGLTVNDTLIAQTGEYGNNIGVVEITISGDKVSKTAKLIPVDSETLTADAAILDKIAELDKANEAVTSVVVGYTPVFLQGEKTAIRTGQSNLCDLITDSMRWATGADFAFTSGGNIRASIDEGYITMGEVLTTLPYSNLLTTVELTGTDVLKILEHGVDMYPEAVSSYIHISGLHFTFDENAEAGSRVKTVTMPDGSALLPDKTYTVATIDYIAIGGDGYEMMQNGKNHKYYGGDAEALVDYLATNPTINAEPEGRVQVSGTQSWAKDIDGHWAASAIETCHSYGIMNGDGNGYYRPDDAITRAEFAAMVNRAFGYDTLDVPELTGYTDVPSTAWYANDIAIAFALGYMQGCGGGIAAPEDIVTREQSVVIMHRILRRIPVTDLTGLPKIEGVSAWAEEAVYTIVSIGLSIEGDFIPQQPMTRGMAAVILSGRFGAIVDEDLDAEGATFQNVTIRKAGVTLKNAVVTGDLFITEGVGDGDVWLENVQIDGRLIKASDDKTTYNTLLDFKGARIATIAA